MSVWPDAGTPVPAEVKQLISAQDHWYIYFTDPEFNEHNNHVVIAWALGIDGVTVVPIISSPSDQSKIVTANSVSPNFVIMNTYSRCEACARPVPAHIESA